MYVLCTLHCEQGESEALSGMRGLAFNISALRLTLTSIIPAVVVWRRLTVARPDPRIKPLNHAFQSRPPSPLCDITSPCNLLHSRRTSSCCEPIPPPVGPGTLDPVLWVRDDPRPRDCQCPCRPEHSSPGIERITSEYCMLRGSAFYSTVQLGMDAGTKGLNAYCMSARDTANHIVSARFRRPHPNISSAVSTSESSSSSVSASPDPMDSTSTSSGDQ